MLKKLILQGVTIPYAPLPDERPFMDRVQAQAKSGIEVSLAVPDAKESRRFFGVPILSRGIQPIWLRVSNGSQSLCRLHLMSIDQNYFSAHEAAAANHYSFGKRLLGIGFLAWVFLPLLIFMPLKLIGAWRANRRIDEFFQVNGFPLKPILPGAFAEGFVFIPLDSGSKTFHVTLLGLGDPIDFEFTVVVPGLDVDHDRREFRNLYKPQELIECDIPRLREEMLKMPKHTTNRLGLREGDPVNLVVVGEFATVLSAFGSRWDETEAISFSSCWKTFKAFLIGSEYRYSPVSPLYMFGRSHDFSLQRIRHSINERLHLRLWATQLRFMGKPVWIGQVSRDIGVRFTWRTWNLTTHRIDPDVDESRDYVVEELISARRLEMAGYGDGVGPAAPTTPRRNLTGDPYFTDGKRVAVLISEKKTDPKFVNWG